MRQPEVCPTHLLRPAQFSIFFWPQTSAKFFAEITSAVSTWKKPSAKGLGFYFKLILKPCSSHRGYLKLTLAITLKQPTGTLKIQRNMVSICSVHGAYYSLMLSNHTSFCTWKVLHYHFIASVQKADIHLCKPALFEPPTVVEDKLWSIAVNVYKRGVHEAPWYKQHSYLVTGKAVSTPWPSLPQMDKNIDAFLSASLGGLFKISSCFKPLSEIQCFQHQSFIATLTAARKGMVTYVLSTLTPAQQCHSFLSLAGWEPAGSAAPIRVKQTLIPLRGLTNASAVPLQRAGSRKHIFYFKTIQQRKTQFYEFT